MLSRRFDGNAEAGVNGALLSAGLSASCIVNGQTGQQVWSGKWVREAVYRFDRQERVYGLQVTLPAACRHTERAKSGMEDRGAQFRGNTAPTKFQQQRRRLGWGKVGEEAGSSTKRRENKERLGRRCAYAWVGRGRRYDVLLDVGDAVVGAAVAIHAEGTCNGESSGVRRGRLAVAGPQRWW